MRIASSSQIVFAVTLIALGILALAGGGFIGIWDSVPKATPARAVLPYLCAVVVLASGAGLFSSRTAAPAARLLLAYLLLWLVAFKVPVILRAPAVEVSWESCAETVVIVSAAWALYAWAASDWDRRRLGFGVGDRGVRIARVLYGLAMIPFGLAHLAYLKETASLVPAWLPAPAVWAALTGCSYIAAGVAVLTGIAAPLAAGLSAVQMGVFTLLVWLPAVATAHADASQWSEAVLSWTLTISGWVIADTYRGAYRLAPATP
jgi:uncharacterized membrane protein YphA (DoxX/SURF4 family)